MPYTFLKLYYTCLWITPPPPISISLQVDVPDAK